MPWFKVDDTLATHPKVVRAGNAAMGLWVRAGSWCASQLTDGYVPRDMLAVLGGRPADARRLVDVGLWREHDGGWTFHGWNDPGRQPTRVETEQRRAEDRERKAAARAEAARKRAAAKAAAALTDPDDDPDIPPESNRSPNGHGPDSGRNPRGVRSTRPDPTRPDPRSTSMAGVHPSTTVPAAGAP